MKTLTKAEEQVMHAIWQIGEGSMGQIYDALPEQKPAYNTIASIVRILEKKGFVDHKAYGRVFVYYPLISKEDYSKAVAKRLISKYFDRSVKKLLSAFSDEDLSLEELRQIEQYVNSLIEKKQKNG